MKKFFSFVAALCIAVAASASVVWTESLDKNGTYIDKSGEQIWGTYWPYVNQWWEAGNMVNEYTSVTSYTCSIRGKKLNGDSQNTIGFYFGAGKTADKCYFNLVNDNGIYTAVEGDKLMFEIASPENGSAAEDIASKLAITINGVALEIPAAIEVPAAASTATVELALPAGEINNIYVSLDNVATQKFIVNFRIEGESIEEGFENATVETKAVKVIRNGQMVIVRDGIEYDVLGTTIK